MNQVALGFSSMQDGSGAFSRCDTRHAGVTAFLTVPMFALRQALS